MTSHCLGQYGPLGAQEVTGNPWGRGAGVSEGVGAGQRIERRFPVSLNVLAFDDLKFIMN